MFRTDSERLGGTIRQIVSRLEAEMTAVADPSSDPAPFRSIVENAAAGIFVAAGSISRWSTSTVARACSPAIQEKDRFRSGLIACNPAPAVHQRYENMIRSVGK